MEAPIKIEVSKTTLALSRGSENNVCFICNRTEDIPEVVIVEILSDVTFAGYGVDSNAYKFCQIAFSQHKKIGKVYILGKLPYQTYSTAFNNSNINNNYLLISIESKSEKEIIDFSEFLLDKKKVFVTSLYDITSYNVFLGHKNSVLISSAKIENKYYLSSKIYPIEHDDAIQASNLTIVSGLLREVPNPVESIQSGNLTIVTGLLRDSIQVTLTYDEAVQASNLTVLSGVLREALQTTGTYDEAIQGSNLTFISGALVERLISNTMETESIQSSNLTIIGGSLT